MYNRIEAFKARAGNGGDGEPEMTVIGLELLCDEGCGKPWILLIQHYKGRVVLRVAERAEPVIKS
jgi:hypothetical protein